MEDDDIATNQNIKDIKDKEENETVKEEVETEQPEENSEDELYEFDESQYTDKFWERTNTEVQMTQAEIDEEIKEKEHVQYIKRVNIEEAVNIIKIYLKYKYEYYIKVM